MSDTFRGEFNQKVDAKARVSVPAVFRRALEAGDPNHPSSPRPRMVLVYGGDDRAFCEVFTILGMRRVEARIRRMKIGDRRRIYLQRNMITLSQEIEVDDDGRIVLPPKARERMGLTADAMRDGAEATFAGMLDSFQIWYRPVYDGDLASQPALAREILPEGEDMSSLLPDDDDEGG
mgnify:FL=1